MRYDDDEDALSFLDEEDTLGVPDGFTPISEAAKRVAENQESFNFSSVPPAHGGANARIEQEYEERKLVEVVIDEDDVLVDLAQGLNVSRGTLGKVLVFLKVGIAVCLVYLALAFVYYVFMRNPWP